MLNKSYFYFICLFIGLSTYAKAQNNIPHLTGSIKNYAKKEISINIHSFWEQVENTLWEKVTTDEKGNFTFTVPFDNFPIRYITISLDGKYICHKLILEPNDKIHIKMDFLKFPKNLQVEGNAAWKIFYYQQDEEYFKSYYNWSPDEVPLPLEQHLALTDSLNNLRFQAFEKVKKQASPIFQQLRQADLAGAVSGKYPNIFDVKQMKFSKEQEERQGRYYDSISLARVISLAPPQDKNLIYSEGYAMYANNLIWSIASKSREYTNYPKETWVYSSYYQFKSLLIPVLAEKILGESIIESVGSPYSFSRDTLLLHDYIYTYPTSKYTPKIQKIYNALVNYQVGKPAYDFELEDMEGKKVKLSNFKGKIVLLDFWGTWCGSCRQEHPFLKNVCKELENTDLQVILIAFYDDKEQWKEYVKTKELQLPNVLNLWAQDTQTAILQESFSFSAAPHKVLIDKQGNILKWKHNHFTSDTSPKIREDLEEILEKTK